MGSPGPMLSPHPLAKLANSGRNSPESPCPTPTNSWAQLRLKLAQLRPLSRGFRTGVWRSRKAPLTKRAPTFLFGRYWGGVFNALCGHPEHWGLAREPWRNRRSDSVARGSPGYRNAHGDRSCVSWCEGAGPSEWPTCLTGTPAARQEGNVAFGTNCVAPASVGCGEDGQASHAFERCGGTLPTSDLQNGQISTARIPGV